MLRCSGARSQSPLVVWSSEVITTATVVVAVAVAGKRLRLTGLLVMGSAL